MDTQKLLPGDVLIQTGGQPWVFGAWLFTGHGCPHAAMVDHVATDGTVWVVECTHDGVRLNPWDKPAWKARRPLCDDSVRLAALADFRSRVGLESYGYLRLMLVALVARTGILSKMHEDADEALDAKTCSESISYHQRKAGIPPCPLLADAAVLPYDLLVTSLYADVDL